MNTWNATPIEPISTTCTKCGKGGAYVNKLHMARLEGDGMEATKTCYCPRCGRTFFTRRTFDAAGWDKIKSFYKRLFKLEGSDEDAERNEKPTNKAGTQLTTIDQVSRLRTG